MASNTVDRGSPSRCICDGCGAHQRSADMCLWTSCGHRRCLDCVWSGVRCGDPESLMLRCSSCSRRCSSATTIEEANTELDKFMQAEAVADSPSTPDFSLCFAELDSKASRTVRSAALHRGLFVQAGTDQVRLQTPVLIKKTTGAYIVTTVICLTSLTASGLFYWTTPAAGFYTAFSISRGSCRLGTGWTHTQQERKKAHTGRRRTRLDLCNVRIQQLEKAGHVPKLCAIRSPANNKIPLCITPRIENFAISLRAISLREQAVLKQLLKLADENHTRVLVA